MEKTATQSWHEIPLSVIGVVVAVIGVVVATIALYISLTANTLTQKQNQVAAQAGLYGQTTELSALYLQPENIWAYKYLYGLRKRDKDGKLVAGGDVIPVDVPTDLDEEKEAQLEMLAEAFTDLFENVVLHLDLLEKHDSDSWKSYIHVVYTRSPTMRDYLERNKASYTDALYSIAMEK